MLPQRQKRFANLTIQQFSFQMFLAYFWLISASQLVFNMTIVFINVSLLICAALRSFDFASLGGFRLRFTSKLYVLEALEICFFFV